MSKLFCTLLNFKSVKIFIAKDVTIQQNYIQNSTSVLESTRLVFNAKQIEVL